MKYIVLAVRSNNLVREMPIVFPNALSHCDVAEALSMCCPELKDAKIVSAGELSSMSFEGGCHGNSSTTGAKSREEEDDRLLMTHDYMHGIK